MNLHPIVLGQKPVLTGTQLGSLSNFRKNHNQASLAEKILEHHKEVNLTGFVLLGKEERSYKKCNPLQTKWLLYVISPGTRGLLFEANTKFTLLDCKLS